MDNIVLTIVIPVYNTPIFALNRIQQTIMEQHDRKFYTVLVDDGSERICANKIDYMAQEIPNCTAVHVINGGVSKARNIGIDMCKTEYVSFADADDILKSDYIMCLNEAIHSYHSDIVIAGIEKLPFLDTPMQSSGKVDFFSGEGDMRKVREAFLNIEHRCLNYQILGTPCARAYRLDIAKQIRFMEGVHFYEDQIFNRQFINSCNSAVVMPNTIYVYIQNEYSAMHNDRNNNFYHKTHLYWDVFYELNKNEPQEYRNSLRKQQLVFLYATINYDYVYPKDKGLKEFCKEIDSIAQHPMIRDAICNLTLHIFQDGLINCFNLILLKKRKYKYIYLEKRIVYLIKVAINSIVNRSGKWKRPE